MRRAVGMDKAERTRIWNSAIRTAARLVEPPPLKANADRFERLTHDIGRLHHQHILRLLDFPDIAVVALAEGKVEP